MSAQVFDNLNTYNHTTFQVHESSEAPEVFKFRAENNTQKLVYRMKKGSGINKSENGEGQSH